MVEITTKKYYCDYCGKEIDPESVPAIRTFGVNHSEGIVVRQMKQYPSMFKDSATLQTVSTIIRDGDYCNTEHFALKIIQLLDESRKKVKM